MKQKSRHNLWMDVAVRVSQESHCIRKKVGAIAVKDEKIISVGWNGTFPGHDNCCEHTQPDRSLVTKKEVFHAEANMLGKLAGSVESAAGATVYITLAPCMDCAKQIAVAGVKQVVYLEEWIGGPGGRVFLNKCGIPTLHLNQDSVQS